MGIMNKQHPKQIAAQKILTHLAKTYTAKAMLNFGGPEDVLMMTLLSARTRDEQVIAAYPKLRKTFPRLVDLALAKQSQIEHEIQTIGLFRSKARAIKSLANILIEQFDGVVPPSMEELIKLPGVGRKTASCVLWYAFNIPAIAVDTHVFRVSHRLGWAKGKTPERVEQELAKVVPHPLWGEMNRIFVQFGRTVCLPGKPRCAICPVRDLCPQGMHHTGSKMVKRG